MLTALPLSLPKPLLSQSLSHNPRHIHQIPILISFANNFILCSPNYLTRFAALTHCLCFFATSANATSQGFCGPRRLRRAVSLLRRSPVLGLFAAAAASTCRSYRCSRGANCSRFLRSPTLSIIWYVIVWFGGYCFLACFFSFLFNLVKVECFLFFRFLFFLIIMKNVPW